MTPASALLSGHMTGLSKNCLLTLGNPRTNEITIVFSCQVWGNVQQPITETLPMTWLTTLHDLLL